MKRKFKKYLKESFCLTSGQHFSIKYFSKNAFRSKIVRPVLAALSVNGLIKIVRPVLAAVSINGLTGPRTH